MKKKNKATNVSRSRSKNGNATEDLWLERASGRGPRDWCWNYGPSADGDHVAVGRHEELGGVADAGRAVGRRRGADADPRIPLRRRRRQRPIEMPFSSLTGFINRSFFKIQWKKKKKFWKTRAATVATTPKQPIPVFDSIFFKQKNRRVLFDARDQREDERFAGAEVALPAAVAVLGPALAPRRRTVGPKNLKIQLKNKKKTR